VSAPKPLPHPDGRVRRSEKSRAAIVDAVFELVGEGVLQPTAQQVAERAGVGIRSVFRHFDDMEGLFAEMAARLRGECLSLLREPGPDGPPRARAEALVRRRARLFERVAPYKRSGNVQRWRSGFLQTEHAGLARELRADLLRSLPELADAAPEVVEAIDLLTSFEAWDRLRGDQRLSRERAEAALAAAVLSLVDGLAGRRRQR
jgi:AcrR family transcriptional regulator